MSRLSLGRELLRRQFNLLIGLAAFIALVVFAWEVVIRAGISSTPLAVGWAY